MRPGDRARGAGQGRLPGRRERSDAPLWRVQQQRYRHHVPRFWLSPPHAPRPRRERAPVAPNFFQIQFPFAPASAAWADRGSGWEAAVLRLTRRGESGRAQGADGRRGPGAASRVRALRQDRGPDDRRRRRASPSAFGRRTLVPVRLPGRRAAAPCPDPGDGGPRPTPHGGALAGARPGLRLLPGPGRAAPDLRQLHPPDAAQADPAGHPLQERRAQQGGRHRSQPRPLIAAGWRRC